MGAHKSNPVSMAVLAGGVTKEGMLKAMGKVPPMRLVYPGDDNHDVVSVEVVFVGSDGRGRLVKLEESDQMAIARTIIMSHNRRDPFGGKVMQFADVVVMPRELAEKILELANTGRRGSADEDEVIADGFDFLGIKREAKS